MNAISLHGREPLADCMALFLRRSGAAKSMGVFLPGGVCEIISGYQLHLGPLYFLSGQGMLLATL